MSQSSSFVPFCRKWKELHPTVLCCASFLPPTRPTSAPGPPLGVALSARGQTRTHTIFTALNYRLLGLVLSNTPSPACVGHCSPHLPTSTKSALAPGQGEKTHHSNTNLQFKAYAFQRTHSRTIRPTSQHPHNLHMRPDPAGGGGGGGVAKNTTHFLRHKTAVQG